MLNRRKRKINWLLAGKLLLFFIIFIIFLRGIKAFVHSSFFSQKDRLNIIFYGPKSIFVSFGLIDGVHYLTNFDNNLLVLVPGGFGYYRIGSLGKLAFLEKKPSIIQKTFSSVMSTYIDFYFLPKKIEIYFDDHFQKQSFDFPRFGLREIIDASYQTNANFFDRLYFFILLKKRKIDFLSIFINSDVKENNRFSEEDFFKKYQGYFYQKFLREENKSLEIYYKNYQSAEVISRIIEGVGIKVVDFTPFEYKGNCLVIEKSEKHSKTSDFLAKIFSCKKEKGETDIGDVKMILGERLEKEWR